MKSVEDVTSSKEELLQKEILFRLYLKIRGVWRLQRLGCFFARIILYRLFMNKETAKIIKEGKKSKIQMYGSLASMVTDQISAGH